MITLYTSIEECLVICEEKGANLNGDCPSFAWTRNNLDTEKPLLELVKQLEGNPVALDVAMFVFENLMFDITPEVREFFAAIIAEDESPVIHALNWRRIVAASKKGAPPPTPLEDKLLRSAWHSSWNERSKLPNWEPDE